MPDLHDLSCSALELEEIVTVDSVDGGVRPKGYYGTEPTFSDLTTLRVGAGIKNYVEVESEQEFIQQVKQADMAGENLLVIGAGSNIVAGQDYFDGTVIRDVRSGIKVVDSSSCGGTTLEVVAGHSWDDLVAFTVSHGLMGLESLSSIPGTVGAAPVQNIGAYGVEVAQLISQVTTYDRATCQRRTFAVTELELGYRTSVLKTSRNQINPHTNLPFGATGRYIVLSVQFHLRHATLSLPIKYKELAQYLGVNLGERVPAVEVRNAVLAIRASKGTRLNPQDKNTQSAGSYFTNPIVDESTANKFADEIPVFDVVDQLSVSQIGGTGKVVEGVKKLSAAAMIQKSGFTKGYGHNDARLSDYHVLVLTNRAEATSDQIRQLAQEIITKVKERYGIELEPEPVYI